MNVIRRCALLPLLFALLTGTQQVFAGGSKGGVIEGGSQVEQRSIQTRRFAGTDKNMVMRGVISALQDLDFLIDAADPELGLVTATKFAGRFAGHTIRITVTVRAESDGQFAVRANARLNEQAIADAQTYQNFFTTLSKSLFLAEQEVE